MKQFIVTTFFLAVCAAHITDSSDIIRKTRETDRWSWGAADDTIVPRSAERSSRQVKPDSVCDPYDPPVPNFSSPSRRKCEVKCYEYIWGIKKRNDEEKRVKACQSHLMNNGSLPRFRTAVVGGHLTLPGEYPHMGAIGWKAAVGTWVFKCGGSLISDKFVLTAAHCSAGSKRDTSIADVNPKIVRLGDKNIIDIIYNNIRPKDSNIQRVIVHPKYDSPKKYYDIALIELEDKVKFDSFVQPACLWPRTDLNGLKSASVTGWGVVESGGQTTSPDLLAGSVDIVENKKCDGLLRPSCNRHWCGIESHEICAGKLTGGVDACQGDSGGPLSVKLPLGNQGRMHTIIGVTSFGIGCALPNLPGIYTRVSSFVDWIEDIVWP